MGSWSATRRLIYLLAVLAVLGALGAALFVVYKPAPSCSDRQQNQNELAVDCGGVCAKVCPVEVLPLKVIWSRVFKVEAGSPAAAGKYDTATFLVNPNQRLGVKKLNYIVKIFDKNNLLVTVRQGQAFVNPQESVLVFDSRLAVGQREPSRALFEVVGAPIWQRIEDVAPAVVTAVKIFTALPTPRLTATISNNSLVDLANVEVTAVLSDSEQNAIAISATVVEYLDSGTTKELIFTWPAPFPVTPAFYNLYPHFDFSKL